MFFPFLLSTGLFGACGLHRGTEHRSSVPEWCEQLSEARWVVVLRVSYKP
jgi:hypothetical protein